MVGINITCPFCGTKSLVIVEEDDFTAWQNGMVAQEAFPYLSAEEREMLISGLCLDCQDKLFCEPEL